MSTYLAMDIEAEDIDEAERLATEADWGVAREIPDVGGGISVYDVTPITDIPLELPCEAKDYVKLKVFIDNENQFAPVDLALFSGEGDVIHLSRENAQKLVKFIDDGLK